MNTARTKYAHRRTNKPLETRKNQNELLLQEDPLIFMLSCEHMFTSANFTLVHIHLQPMKAHSLLLTAAFSERMCQVASTVVLGLPIGLLWLEHARRATVLAMVLSIPTTIGSFFDDLYPLTDTAEVCHRFLNHDPNSTSSLTT